VAVEPLPAVTTYAFGFVKSFDVVPLTWFTPFTDTLLPVVMNPATSAVTSVPYGTVTAMVFADSSMVPRATGLDAVGLVYKANAVIALASESGSEPPPAHPVISTEAIAPKIKTQDILFFMLIPPYLSVNNAE
jgi:hypothetical protein